MRDWYDFILKKGNKNTLNRFEYTDEVLIYNQRNFKENFNFDSFKKNEHGFKTYSYLKNKLKKKQIFFVGSSWGWVEFFLSKEFPLIASDINENYVNFHKNNSKFEYIKFDILEEKIEKHLENKFEQVVVNNIEYLFDQNQMQKCLYNLSKIIKKDGDMFFMFRSKDSLLIKIIDNYLLPLENIIVKYIKNLSEDKVFLTKNHHGYRRDEKDFINIIKKNNYELKSIYREMFDAEYNRLRILRYLKISKLLSTIFFKLHSHLNIIHFKKQ
jgi:2-polyprenyl-3-methyl-5-hydroxy-6-metoxy-1,4-benzoquinol methylase